MPRHSNRPTETPLDKQKKALEARASEIQAKLDQTKKIQQEIPVLRAKAKEREQQEIISQYHRPVNMGMLADHRFDLLPPTSSRVKKLRKEKSKAPLLTFVLLVMLGFAVYYSVRSLWNG